MKQRSSSIFAIVAICLIGIAFIAFLVYQKNKSATPLRPQPSSEQEAVRPAAGTNGQPVTVPSDKQQWQMYQDENLGAAFLYPQDWYVGYEADYERWRITDTSDALIPGYDGFGDKSIFLSKVENVDEVPVSEFIKGWETSENYNESFQTIAGVSSIRITTIDERFGAPIETYFIPQDKYVFVLEANGEEEVNILNEFVKNFRWLK